MNCRVGSLAAASSVFACFATTHIACALVVNIPTTLVWGSWDDSTIVNMINGGDYTVSLHTTEPVHTWGNYQFDGMLYYVPDPTIPSVRTFVGSYGGPNGASTLAWERAGSYQLDAQVATVNFFGYPVGSVQQTIHITIESNTPVACVHGIDPQCNDNVLFLPGIEASRLYDTDGGETKVWEPENDSGAEALLLDTHGISIHSDIYTRDVMDDALFGSLGPSVYAPFIDTMNTLKNNGTIVDWEAAPYDWRLSLDDILASGAKTGDSISYITSTSSPYIIQEVKRLAASSRTSKITIVAHSNGGLLAKKLMLALGSDASTYIDRIIMVDVPQLGTPAATAALLHGTDQGLPLGHLSPGEARKLAINAPMTYNLLPSAQYFAQVSTPVIAIDSSMPDWVSNYGAETHSNGDQRAFVLGSRTQPAQSDLTDPAVGNAELYDAGVAEHTMLDSWVPPSGVEYDLVTGWGNETLSGITYRMVPVNTCTVWMAEYCVHYEKSSEFTIDPQHTVDGDGTVVDTSAMWSTTPNVQKWWVNLHDYNDPIYGHPCFTEYCKQHYNILAIPDLDTLIQDIITGASSTSSYITQIKPVTTDATKRIHLTLHSPLSLGFVDAQGDYTGASTSTVAADPIFTIPGINYERYGNVQWLSIPADREGTVVLYGQGNGSFTLDMDEDVSGTSVGTSFAGIPSSSSTIATIVLTPSSDAVASSTLTVDYAGDGSHISTYHAQESAIVQPDLSVPDSAATSMVSGGSGPLVIQVNATSTDSTSTSSTATSTSLYHTGIWNATTTPVTYIYRTDEQGNVIQFMARATIEGITYYFVCSLDEKRIQIIVRSKSL